MFGPAKDDLGGLRATMPQMREDARLEQVLLRVEKTVGVREVAAIRPTMPFFS
jgi:hypothetical protein